jgi:hypothetical protein
MNEQINPNSLENIKKLSIAERILNVEATIESILRIPEA